MKTMSKKQQLQTRIHELVKAFFGRNNSANEARREADQLREELFQLMEENGLQVVTVDDLIATVSAPERSVVDGKRLLEMIQNGTISLEAAAAILSSVSLKSIRDNAGAIIQQKVCGCQEGTKNVSVKRIKA